MLGIVCSSQAIKDLSVCEEPTYSCGPLPPVIPESYILKYEWIDLVRNQTAWMEEYFDSENLRAKLSVVLRGQKVVYIYDYFRETVTSYSSDRPGAKPSLDPWSQESCEITEMAKFRGTQLPFGFKYRGDRPHRSRMDSSQEAMRFGGPYRARFVREATGEETRHLPANLFESCAYDKFDDATYRMRYYWSANASFMFPNAEVVVPIRIEQEGTFTDHEDHEKVVPWNTIRNVAWYQSKPEFSDEDFEAPRQTYCKNEAKAREAPEAPRTFSFRVEQLSFTLDETGFYVGEFTSTSYKEVWYDAAMRLARVDIIPSEEEKSLPLISDSGSLDTMLSIVVDFGAEAAFVTHPSSGDCVVRKLPRDFFLVDPNITEGVGMLEPESLFGFSDKHRFHGKYKIRDIEVETWTALIKEANESAKEQTTRRHEISFMTDSEAERLGERDLEFVPVQETIYEDTFQTTKNGLIRYRQHVTMKNYFMFSSEQPPLSVYEAPGCIPRHEARAFKVSFDGKDIKGIRENRAVFTDALRGSLKDYGDIDTILRVYIIDVKVYGKKKELVVFFEILAPLTELEQERIVTIDEAAQNIEERVKNGTFAFTLVLASEDGQTEVQSFKALKDSFAEAQFSKTTNKLYYQPQKATDDVMKSKENSVSEEGTGYSAGVFAAIAFVFTLAGILCGVFAMRFYLTRKGSDGLIENEERPIELQ